MQVLALLVFVALATSSVSAIRTTPATLTGTWKGACMSYAYRPDPNSPAYVCAGPHGPKNTYDKGSWDWNITYTDTTVTYHVAATDRNSKYLPMWTNPSGTYSLKQLGVSAKISANYPGCTTSVFAIAKQIGPVRNNVFQYIEDGIIDLASGQNLAPPNKNGAALFCDSSKFNYRCTATKIA